MSIVGKVTELEFEKIKDNLKAYFRRKDSPFKDWDFTGSGLSYLLDILAYNTHYNAVNAHLSMNESFLDSAQLRSNVVSRAKLIGYTPRSKRGARAKIQAEFERKLQNDNVDSIILPRGTIFSTSVRGSNYTFITTEDRFAVFDAVKQLFVFEDLEIVQGEMVTHRYIVDGSLENQRYVIHDKDIDTYTLQVRVYGHADTNESTVFVDGSTLASVGPSAKVYFLSENYEGKYQIEFGDGIIGEKLQNLNIVEVSFLSTAGQETNGAKVFRYITSPSTKFNQTCEISMVQLREHAYGGDDRETIESIRQTAPYSYIAQNRTVSERDFETLIRKNIPDIEAISVWGGQDHIPPQFGKVFISAKPKSGFFLSRSQKSEILSFLDSVKVVTTRPEILDPDYVYLYFETFFNYDSSITSLSRSQLEHNVRENLIEFNTNVVRGFEKVFRYSQFLSTIDDTNEAILNSFARIYVYKNMIINPTRKLPYTLSFNMTLFGDVSQKKPILTSSSWLYNNRQIQIEDEPISNNVHLRNVYAFYYVQDGKVIIDPSIGTLDVRKGILSLDTIPTTNEALISVSAIPDAYDISTQRNQLIDIDFTRTTITGRPDTAINKTIGLQPVSRFS